MRPLIPRRTRSGLVVALAVAVVGFGMPGPAFAAEVDSAGSPVRLVVLGNRSAPHDLARAVASSALAARGLKVVSGAGGSAFTIEVPAGEVADATQALQSRADVAAVAPVTEFGLFDVPDDAKYSQEKTYLSAMHLPKAWTLTHGSTAVKVAVIDSGVDVNHADLAGKVAGTFNAVDQSDDVTDDEGHGTAVASMAAAATDNGKGIAGAGWDVRILAVKVEDPDGDITNAAIARGIRWAISNNADVINLSLGGPVADAATQTAVSEAVAAGIVVVAAAGNSGGTTKFYPAAYPKVLAVGATGPKGKARAGFSQHGSWVDVGAPGQAILGAEAGTTSGYVSGEGTSFSAPLVSGVAALIRSFRPELSQGQVRAAITATAGKNDLGFGHGLVDAAAALAYKPSFAGPVVTAPLSDATVSGDTQVKARQITDDLVTQVRAGFVGGGSRVTAPVADGKATFTVPTYGLSGPQVLLVTECRGTVCSATGTEVHVTVDNAAPALTAPADGAVELDEFEVAAEDNGSPAVRFIADGTKVLGTDTTAPFSIQVPIRRLTPGAHTLTAVVCDATGTICASDKPSPGRDITVERLSPSISEVHFTPFSPNGDGHRDLARVTYSLDVRSDVTVRILRSDGSELLRQALGSKNSGQHTWQWDGRGSGGTAPKSGTYTVVIATAATVDGDDLVGEARHQVVVDLSRPALTHVAHSQATVFPVKDGYVDSVRLSVSTAESLSSLTLTVTDAKHHKVWSATKHSLAAGRLSFTFKGHRHSGGRLSPGTYHFEFTAIDRAGNRRTSAPGTVKVSAKRLSATRTGHKTVTAYGSFDYYVVGDDADDSQVWRTRWSAGSLLWDPSGGSVLSLHHTKLPRAAVYGSVHVDAFGRGTKGATAYEYAVAPNGSFVHQSHYGAGTGTHVGDTVALSKVLKGQRLSWGLGVYNKDRYEIKTFTVTWTYRVLV